MSRIGRLPIVVPANVTVSIGQDNKVVVKGPLGQLERKFLRNVSFKQEGNEIIVSRINDEKESKALHGLSRSLLANMVAGVDKGFERSLIINGVGFKANKQGNKLVLNIGFSHPVEVLDANGITTSCKTPTEVVVKGIDKEQVGAFAASIRDLRKVEPYHAYGIRYSDEVVVKKEGKKTAGKK